MEKLNEMLKISTVTKYGGCAENAVKNTVAKDGIKLEAACATDDPEVIVALANYGLASLLYRGGASLLNGAFGKTANTEVEYSDERAEKAQVALSAWFANGCPNKKGTEQSMPKVAVTVLASRHVHGEVADSKFTEETEIVSRHESAGDLDEWLEGTVGYGKVIDGELDLPTHTEDGTAFAVEMLRAVRGYKIRRMAELKKGI